MRCVLVFVVLVTGSIASAEPRRTTESVTLRKKPGEKETAVATVPANTEVTVLGEEGRWLKVKVNGNTGYLTRTTVSGGDAKDVDAKPQWSAARRTEDGKEMTELFVEAPKAGALVTEPKPGAGKIADIAKGARLVVLDATTPGWLHARDDGGHEGWIATGEVQNGATAVTVSGAGVDLAGSAVEQTYTRPPVGALAIRAEVGLAYRSLGMDLTSNAEGGLTNYLVDADAAAAVIDVDARQQLSPSLFAGADLRMVASESSPGIDYPGPTAPPGKIPFATFATDVGVRAGIHAKQAFDLALRLGGHYDAFLPKSVDNAGSLPRERLIGVTAGVRADIVPPHSRFGAAVRFDIMALGSRAQTPGLEDGTSSTARALWGGVTVRYQLGRHISPFAGYDFGRASTDWTGMSVREPSVTDAHRVDTTQLVQIGVSAEL